MILPTCPHAPRDKAKIEVGVLVAQRWILARLRHETFFSLEALNARIAELVEDLNRRIMRLYRASRRELFERLDQPSLADIAVARFGAGVTEVRPVGAQPCAACARNVLWRSAGLRWACRACNPPIDLRAVSGWCVKVRGGWSAVPPRLHGSLARARRVKVKGRR